MTERLTAADSWFLYLETPAMHLHVVGLMMLDPGTAEEGHDFAALRAHLEERLHLLDMFRRRLVEVPLGVDHPVWTDDPEFDLDRHLRHVVLDEGTYAELRDLIDETCSEPLPRDAPLWEMTYAEGLEDGLVGLVVKIHHSLIDGESGMDFMAELLDLEPEGEPPEPPAGPWEPAPLPTAFESVRDAVVDRLRAPMRPWRAAVRTGRSTLAMALAAGEARRSGHSAAGPFDAPRAPFNAALSSRRSVSFGTTSLQTVKQIRKAFDATVNDVVLAACCGGLRTFLRRTGDLPDRPLTCAVPVSLRGRGGTEDDAGPEPINQVSNMFVHLPVQLEDPVEQLRAIRRSAGSAKVVQAASGPEMIGDAVDLMPPPLFRLGARLMSATRLADLVPPTHNLIISNVKGSPVPLYIAGARLVGLYPFGPILEGTALNISVISNLDELDFGLITCPDLVSDPDALRDDIFDAIGRLSEAAERTKEAQRDRGDRRP